MDVEQLVTNFVIACDVQRLTLSDGIAWAESIADALVTAAEERRDGLLDHAPELIDDDAE